MKKPDLATFLSRKWVQTVVIMLFIVLLFAIMALLQLGQDMPFTEVVINCGFYLYEYRELVSVLEKTLSDFEFWQTVADYALDGWRTDSNWEQISKCCCLIWIAVLFFLFILFYFLLIIIGSRFYLQNERLLRSQSNALGYARSVCGSIYNSLATDYLYYLSALVLLYLLCVVLMDCYLLLFFSGVNYESLELQDSHIPVIDSLSADAKIMLENPEYRIYYNWIDRYNSVKSDIDKCVWRTPQVTEKMKLLAEYAEQLQNRK